MSNASTLPPVDHTAPAAAPAVAPVPTPVEVAGNGSTAVPIDLGATGAGGPASKEIAIGVGALLVAAIIFFFIRQGYVNWLVGSQKRSPNSASLAGWGLFGCLFFGTAIGCIGLISGSLLTLPFVAPLAGLSLVCLVICITSSTKR